MPSAKVSAPPATARRAAGAPSKRIPPLVLPLLFTIALGLMSLQPRVRSNPKLSYAFWGATLFLLAGIAVLRLITARSGRVLQYEFVLNTVHWVQPLMHSTIYVYWGMYWPEVGHLVPLIVAQIAFIYAFDMLVCWSHRDKWILGFGPVPIVLSTNLFLCFHDDWFFLQFALIATGVLGKEFIRWQKDGRSAHIFNPSAFSLFIFSVGLLVTHNTAMSWGEEIATTIGRPPHIYLVIFLVGLIVQGLFQVTLVTLAAAGALFTAGLLYTHFTGVYNFIDTNIPASVFLGLHLLVTDPATSPRTTPGKFVFGWLYGLGVFGLYIFLADINAPRFYDKLLCVPLLNLTIQGLDRASRSLARRVRAVDVFSSWNTRKANFGFMGVWVGLYCVMVGTGFMTKGKDHPGNFVEFWENACAQNRVNGCREWVHTLNITCLDGAASSCMQLGTLAKEGRLTKHDPLVIAKSYGRACDLGIQEACESLTQFVRAGGKQDLQASCDHGDSISCFILAWLTDRGTAFLADPARAVTLFKKSCTLGYARACGVLAECYRKGEGTSPNPGLAIVNYEIACRSGHAPSCVSVAMMYRHGAGVPVDEDRAQLRLKDACNLGVLQACGAGQTPRPVVRDSMAETTADQN